MVGDRPGQLVIRRRNQRNPASGEPFLTQKIDHFLTIRKVRGIKLDAARKLLLEKRASPKQPERQQK